jgi:preprotein translocase subunit SecE
MHDHAGSRPAPTTRTTDQEEGVSMSDGNTVRSRGEKRTERTSPALFYRQVVAELRKVVYPSQQQLITYFFVVMVFVLFMMALVSGLDLGFGKLVFWVFDGRANN